MRLQLVLLILMLLPALAHAGYSSTVTLASDYIFRGIGYNSAYVTADKTATATTVGGVPVVQGSIDYVNDKNGLLGGVWGSNIMTAGGYEMDPYLGYWGSSGDIDFTFYVIWYHYVRITAYNALEGIMTATYKDTKLTIGYMPEYFNLHTPKTSSAMYLNLFHPWMLNKKLTLNASAGYTIFGSPDNVVFYDDNNDGGTEGSGSNYMDYKIGIAYSKKNEFTTELSWIGTNRQLKDATGKKQTINDSATLVSISKTF